MKKNDELKLTGNDESLSSQNDTDVLGANEKGSFSQLSSEISKSGNVKLKYKNYVYGGSGDSIYIEEANKVIDGNGAVIDRAGSNFQALVVTSVGVTIKNLTIKNADSGYYGSAIYFGEPGTVMDCTFVNNKASLHDGGAVYFNVGGGKVTNCNLFIYNKLNPV